MGCKNICKQYKATGSVKLGRYNNGQKKCKACDLFIVWSGFRCPCCGYKLRSIPHNKKYKERLRALKGKK